MKDRTLKIISAMSLIATLEVINMVTLKADGGIFTIVVSAISGLAGYEIAKKRNEK